MSIPKPAFYYALVIFVLFLAVFSLHNLLSDISFNQVIFYYVPQLSVAIGLIILPAIWIAFLFHVSRSNSLLYLRAQVLCFISLTAINTLMILLSIVRFGFIVSSTSELTTVDTNQYYYRLDSITSQLTQDDYDSITARLWQCDHTGLFCKIIFTLDSLDYSNDYAPRLVYERTTNNLNLILNGQTVYASDYLYNVDGP